VVQRSITPLKDRPLEEVHDERTRLRALRRDLERLRMLLELVKKRERCKLELVCLLKDDFDLHVSPLRRALVGSK